VKRETPHPLTDRLTPEQRAQVRVAVATWPPLTPETEAKPAILFDREPPPEPQVRASG
jgi:hypothetical protein